MTDTDILKVEQKLDKLSGQLSKMYASLSANNQTVLAIQREAIDHETRIRLLEKWQNGLTPLFAAGTFILGCVATAVILRYMA